MILSNGRIAVPKGEGDNMETPPWLFERLNRAFSFTNDTACTETNALAPPVGRDCLTVVWGARNFLNPPYSNPGPFVAKAVEEQERGNLTVALLKYDHSVVWWNTSVRNYATLYMIPFRVRFYYKGHPTRDTSNFPSVLAIYMPRIEKP